MVNNNDWSLRKSIDNNSITNTVNTMNTMNTTNTDVNVNENEMSNDENKHNIKN